VVLRKKFNQYNQKDVDIALELSEFLKKTGSIPDIINCFDSAALNLALSAGTQPYITDILAVEDEEDILKHMTFDIDSLLSK